MSTWGNYKSRLDVRGVDRRDIALRREVRNLNQKSMNGLFYKEVSINEAKQKVCVINSDDLTLKTVFSMPGEDIVHGSVINWMDSYWLVIQRDADNELYTKCTMRQCNYKLRWVAEDLSIVERWCIVEDGTKYLTGEYGDNQFVLTRGDMRISVTMPRDEYTVGLTRTNRFLIDDYHSPTIAAYELTKPFKLGSIYGGNGVLCFVMQECNTVDTDNFDLHIANYYDYFPIPESEPEAPETPDVDSVQTDEGSERKVWI